LRRAGPILCILLLAAVPSHAKVTSRSYLAFALGPNFLTGDVGGDVITSRATSWVEIGVGYQLSRTALIEFTYGWNGTFTQEGSYYPLTPGTLPPDTERAFKVAFNPMLLRMRYAPGGVRTEYLKPELSAGIGFMQVSRLLRNAPSVPPEDTSQLLVAGEIGLAGLVVFSKNFMGTFGVRYTFTERRGIVDDLDHASGAAMLLGFRIFLPSPRDVEEP
jgi:hypothetical protein